MTKRLRNSKPDASPGPEEEMAKLLKEQRKHEGKHARLTAELLQTEWAISNIRAKRGAIHNRKISVLNLPNEVTCIIFDYAFVHSVLSPNGSSSSKKIPLFEVVASHVCHHWRFVALSYPQLWSHFRYNSKRGPSLVSLAQFNAYMERSRNVGLELWFNFRAALGDLDDYIRLTRRALRHYKRWKRFTLLSDLESPVIEVHLCMRRGSMSAPMLEHFALCAEKGNGTEGFSGTITSMNGIIFKGGTPNLKSVSLDLTGAFFCLPSIRNVTTLHLETRDESRKFNLPIPLLWDVLTLPPLVDLSIIGDLVPPLAVDYDRLEPIMLPSLKHLRVAMSTLLVYLLPFIRAPLLETLTLKDVDFPPSFATRPHGGVVPISNLYMFPALQSLCFINVSALLVRTTRQFATMTANATEITFSEGTYEENFFTTFADRSLPKEILTPWPKLKVLTFNVETNNLNGLMRLVKNRPKKSVTLRLFDDINEELQICDLTSTTTYAQLARVYKIETIDSNRNWLRQVNWPPSTEESGLDRGLFSEEPDPFSIDEYYDSSSDSDSKPDTHTDTDTDTDWSLHS
ncbi:hypothetical protein CVT26_016111 [Gymnopilus dilepis]|uniref:Uncharacterized protein n=1 Tax=Gymnopilus dilepis TaxID=231916 RepID=A0A409XYY5_9AGAR|nr:hypothetical protein CVT26_016111 [Gymnopilus dilepis]